MSLLIYFVPYVYLFLCFMVHCARRGADTRLLAPGGTAGAVVAGVSGVSVTLFAMVVAMIPPPGTADIWLHEAKLGGGSLLLILLGGFVYRRSRRKHLRGAL
jgi:hypothetical protein